MEEGALGVIAGIVVAGLGYLGVRYTARESKKASEVSAMMAAPQSIAAGYDMLNDDLWRNITDLRARVAALELEVRTNSKQYRAAISYIRRLLALLTQHAPEVHAPEPPAELRDDVPNGRHPKRKDQP